MFPPGQGDCVCSSDGEMCGCKCACGTAPLSQKQYSGDDCGCDPDNCYNEIYPSVSWRREGGRIHAVLCESG